MTNIKYPPCAVGTWAWGSGINGGKMIFGKNTDDSVLCETFERAYDLGFTLWDTAEVYGMGNAEKTLSRCIAEKKGADQSVMIATKYMPSKKYRAGSAREALLGSLSRLKLDHADIYWLHLPNNIEENMHEFAELMKEGRIKAAGVSNFDLEQVRLADKILREDGFELSAVQNHFSLIRRDAEQQRVIDWCAENNRSYFSYMVLEQGALSGRYDDEHKFPMITLRGLAFNGKLKKLRPLIDFQRELGKKYGVNPAQIAVSWAISKGTVPIVGLTKPSYAEDLAKGCKLRLTEEETARLEVLADMSGVVSKGVWEPDGIYRR